MEYDSVPICGQGLDDVAIRVSADDRLCPALGCFTIFAVGDHYGVSFAQLGPDWVLCFVWFEIRCPRRDVALFALDRPDQLETFQLFSSHMASPKKAALKAKMKTYFFMILS
jgi:hypothetical protein